MREAFEALVKIPFQLAEKVTEPVCDVIENLIGEEVDQISDFVPGSELLNENSKKFNEWVKADKRKKIAEKSKDQEKEK